MDLLWIRFIINFENLNVLFVCNMCSELGKIFEVVYLFIWGYDIKFFCIYGLIVFIGLFVRVYFEWFFGLYKKFFGCF